MSCVYLVKDTCACGVGSVYVFSNLPSNSIWSEQQKLLAVDGSSSHEFGRCVAMYDNVIIVGAPKDDDNGADAGSDIDWL